MYITLQPYLTLYRVQCVRVYFFRTTCGYGDRFIIPRASKGPTKKIPRHRHAQGVPRSGL